MAKLTAKQRKWMEGVQKALNAPGGEGICFAAGGDPNIILFEAGHDQELMDHEGDPVGLCQRKGWVFDDSLDFPGNVEAWCI